MGFRYYGNYQWAQVALVVILHVGAALAAAPVALVSDLAWNMVKAPMFHSHYGIDVGAIFGNSADAIIVRTSSQDMINTCTSDVDGIYKMYVSCCSGSTGGNLVSLQHC